MRPVDWNIEVDPPNTMRISKTETSIVLYTKEFHQTGIDIQERYLDSRIPNKVVIKVFCHQHYFNQEKTGASLSRGGQHVPEYYGEFKLPNEGKNAIALQYLHGRTLQQSVKADKEGVKARWTKIAAKMWDAITDLLSKHLDHGDLALRNVMLVPDPSSAEERVYLIDFSEATKCDEQLKYCFCGPRDHCSKNGGSCERICACYYSNIGGTVNVLSEIGGVEPTFRTQREALSQVQDVITGKTTWENVFSED